MDIYKKWGAIAGAVIVTGALLVGGVALADSSTPPTTNVTTPAPGAPATKADRLGDAVKSGKLTQGEADVMKQLMDLHKSTMTQLQANQKALIDQAVKDGKITQDQANKLQSHMGHGRMMKQHQQNLMKLSQSDLQTKLDEAVKSGKMTQQQADRLMSQWQKHQSNAKQDE